MGRAGAARGRARCPANALPLCSAAPADCPRFEQPAAARACPSWWNCGRRVSAITRHSPCSPVQCGPCTESSGTTGIDAVRPQQPVTGKENDMQAYSRRDFLKTTAVLGAGAAAGLGFPAILAAQGGGPVKVGVLHSLSGTMAISEVSLRDVVLMAIEEINGKGGVLGRKIEPGGGAAPA